MKTTSINLDQYELFIDGGFCTPENKNYFDVVNPSNGEVIAKIAEGTAVDARRAVAAARRAFDKGEWPKLSIHERGEYLKKIAHLIRENAKVLADLECQNTGKTIKHTTFIDVPTCADTFEYFAGVEAQLKEHSIDIPAEVKSLLTRDPMGVVACIIPWNYPLIMTAWKMAPALIAGNTIVFKPSQAASLAIMKLADIIRQAGLPKGAVNIVSGGGFEVGSELAQNPDVDMISFTGSSHIGQEVMRLASNNTKKICLELGGKSPNIVLGDCDLETAVGGTMSAIFMNQGQMCTAGSRLILDEKIYDKFMDLLTQRTKKLKIGEAMSYETDFGPLINESQRKTVMSFIEKGIKEGAKLVCGGKIPQTPELSKGFYLEPTIFADVKNSMTIAQEEIFGPVLSVIKFKNTDEAIAIANDTKYGLASCIWTKDLDKANKVSKQLRCGTVWINTYGGFYNEAPYGGYKQSGFGRELGQDGLLEYTQTKHICTDATPSGKPLVASWF